MKHYNIIIKLANGDEVTARMEAADRRKAIEAVTTTKELKDFVGDKEIVDIEAIEVEMPPHNNELDYILRYSISASPKPDYVICIDKETSLAVLWHKGRFNETQDVECADEQIKLSAQEIATALREMADFLQKYFKELM